MNCDEMLDHDHQDQDRLVGILDRDQRTVRCTNFKSSGVVKSDRTSTSTSPSLISSTTTSFQLRNLTSTRPVTSSTNSTSHWRTRKTKSMWKIVQRLLRALVVSVLLPRIYCAPMSMSQKMSERMNSHPKWINPCGIGSNEMMTHDGDAVVVSDGDLLSQILVQARIALSEADSFKEDYVERAFNMDFEKNHKIWKTQRYPWLPNWEQVPKNLGENVPEDYLEKLELNKALLDVYEYLQTVAVGLEQIVWDQDDEQGPFYNNFKDAEFKLRALLCEIQVAILEHSLTMRPDVTRDVMTEEYRNSENMSSRYLRDWLIFRDYMNALEYVIEVFEYLKKNL